MTALLLISGFAIYVIVYFTLGKYVEKKVIKADPERKTPAHEFYDGVDFIPAHRSVLFGHHFASIAGAAPIVGPVIALAWGWLPGLLWVWLGNIFIGAFHDYFALMASVRCRGSSIQYIAIDIFGKKTGRYIQWFVLFLLVLVIAAFGAIIGQTFTNKPDVASSYFFTIIASLILGYLMYRKKMEFRLATLCGIIMLILALWLGSLFPVSLTYNIWMLILFIYIIVASALPVDVLLQPRDYLNSWLLYAGIALGMIGAIGSFSSFSAPAVTRFAPVILESKPTPFWPLIPLIIACGSLSGFHSLVASGTTSKQLNKETDGLFIGMGSMFTEGFLSTLVIIAVSAFGIMVLEDKPSLLSSVMSDWGTHYNLLLKEAGGNIGLFSFSYAKMINKTLPFISEKFLTVFAAIWVSSFALTTLDTTNRLGRYVISDLASPLKENFHRMHCFLTNNWFASLVPAAIGISMALSGSYKIIWPVFSAANQLLASIALITGTMWVVKANRIQKTFWLILPAFFLWLTVTCALGWFMAVVLPVYLHKNMWTGAILSLISIAMMIINIMLVEALYKQFRKKGHI